MRHIVQTDLEIIARHLKAIEGRADTYVRLMRDEVFASNDVIRQGPTGLHAVEAISRLIADLPDAYTPIVVSSNKDGVRMTVSGADLDLENMAPTLDSIAYAARVIEDYVSCIIPEDGGGHRYLIGSTGANLTHTARTVDADTPDAAIIKYIAGRVNLTEVSQIPEDLDFRQPGTFSMRRAHDWKRYDFDEMAAQCCTNINLTLSLDRSRDDEVAPGF